MVVQTSQDWLDRNASVPLNRTGYRRIFVRGEMRSNLVVICGIHFEYLLQVQLAEHDEVIHALAPD